MHPYNVRAIVAGAIATAVGTVILLGIWFPRIRFYHKGSQIRLGKLSTAFAALLPGSWGILLVWLGIHPEEPIPVLGLVIPFILAVGGLIYGTARDSRSSAPAVQNQSVTDQNKSGTMSPRAARLTALILALALGQFLYLRASSAWTNYWLLTDAQKGTATVTKELWSGHNAVGYKYVVNGNEYTGHSGRNWQDEKYSKVQVGEESVVYFSASHPSISLLYMPRTLLEGLPVIIIVLILEAFAVITIINPKSGWAFSLIDKEQKRGT